jgi:hypothetical protein
MPARLMTFMRMAGGAVLILFPSHWEFSRRSGSTRHPCSRSSDGNARIPSAHIFAIGSQPGGDDDIVRRPISGPGSAARGGCTDLPWKPEDFGLHRSGQLDVYRCSPHAPGNGANRETDVQVGTGSRIKRQRACHPDGQHRRCLGAGRLRPGHRRAAAHRRHTD